MKDRQRGTKRAGDRELQGQIDSELGKENVP